MARRRAAPSLVRRLVLLAAVWSTGVLAASAILLGLLFEQAALRRFDWGLADLTDSLAASALPDPAGGVRVRDPGDLRTRRVYSGRYWQVSRTGPEGRVDVLARSRSLWDTELALPADLAGTLDARPSGTLSFEAPGPEGQKLRVRATRLVLPGDAAPVIILAAEDRRPVDAEVRRFFAATAAVFVLLALGLIAAVVVQVRLGLRPLFALSQEIADLRSGRADQLGGAYPSELTPLADQLNALVRHNRESLERQRAHVGNLAHALKTPLAVLSAAAGSERGDLADLVTQQAGVMQTQVDHHLRRARAAARLPGAGAVTPVAEVLDDLTRTLMRLHREAGIRMDWDAPDDLVFLGERQDLLEICGNLLENACKWGRGRITVRGAASGPDRLVLEIDDNGPGLDPERRREALARGGRLDESAPGSGLGLSIVSDLVRAYGGVLDLAASPMGGLRVRLDLPRSAD
ncbi:MAG: sensor histidine kinase [Phenylobacterium sp.]|uniref:ATP-binding protein n=1 Tax=Phenylobacterium sp. TaxID=1871053 RepID=UPI0025F52B46|nr:ATP-binding protein [Phenylobacterium sp.]MCA3711936.1 sensor histidine kinase [Phenylobacterium sp.]MCA3745775.1 sensor histidine kinase [Phenylobacterium sp.]MCA3751230.1 sensor histidine kinase [Phenylobacterium sp.]MCA4916481.1 sensor histidine kinase [Phenylobacterium sp.]MCA6230334.1 sensor histidine kinase [Phenylobacterium sp.]